jgi:hypothetical protein
MTRNLYALLVGIDEYDERSHLPALKGCVNDIQAFKAYLEGRVNLREFDLHLRVLINQQASRQGIIDGFRQHLAQAKSDDVALFYYAGHGAQTEVPKALESKAPKSKAIESEAIGPTLPNRITQTLVCYDSRIDDHHWDLAQLELAQLIAEVSQNNPHITLVLDCGYAIEGAEAAPSIASATRGVAAQTQFLSSFLSSSLLSSTPLSLSESAPTRPLTSFIALTDQSGRYVSLSACLAHEVLTEWPGAAQSGPAQPSSQPSSQPNSQHRGAFSYFLQASLAGANGSLSYQDLFERTNALLRSSVPTQSPQLQATHPADLEQPFLGGAIAPIQPHFTASHHPEDGWIIDGGAVHGLRTSTANNDTTHLALFPYYSPPEQMKDTSEAIATAKVTQVLPRFSKIDSSGLAEAKATDIFKAIVTSTPLPPLPVLLEGDATKVAALRRAIAIAGPNRQPSAYVRAIHSNPEPSANQAANQAADQAVYGAERVGLRVRATRGTYVITSAMGDRALVKSISGYDEAIPSQRSSQPPLPRKIAATVTAALEHIAQWKTIAELDSPASSQIHGTLQLKIYTGTEPTKEAATEIIDSQIRLTYQKSEQSSSSKSPSNSSSNSPSSRSNQTWLPPRFRIKLHNTSNQTLYCALIYLNDRFKAVAIKPDSINNIVQLLPNQEMWFAGGTVLKGTVPDSLWNQGLTECQDILKLIACTEAFDPTLLNLSALVKPSTQKSRAVTGNATKVGSLNKLLQRAAQRSPSPADAAAATYYNDWITNQIAFTFVRPQLPVPLSQHKEVSIGTSANTSSPLIKIQPHPQLQAHVQLVTLAQSFSRGVVPPPLPNQAQPFQFTQAYASDPGLSILVFDHLKHSAAITPTQPLRLQIAVPLSPGKQLLPIAFDGKSYFSIGYGTGQGAQTQLVIERLTQPVSTTHSLLQKMRQRSPQKGSIWIFFQQVDQATSDQASMSVRVSPFNNPAEPANAPAIETAIRPTLVRPISTAVTATDTAESLSLDDWVNANDGANTAAVGAESVAANTDALTADSESLVSESLVSEPLVSESLVSEPLVREPLVREPAPIPSLRQNFSGTSDISTANLTPNSPNLMEASSEMPLSRKLPTQQPNQAASQAPNQAASRTSSQAPNQAPEPSEIYAPRTERSPEAGTSPLMWVWVLFTALLAGLVAWGWIQYLQSPNLPAPKTEPAPVKPALPSDLPSDPIEPSLPK